MPLDSNVKQFVLEFVKVYFFKAVEVRICQSFPLYSINKINYYTIEVSEIYHIVKNSGREKLWRIDDFNIFARKTLVNA